MHYATAPKAERPKKTAAQEQPKKRGRPPKAVEDLRTDTERYADEEAAKARAEIAAKKTHAAETKKKESDDDGDDQDR